MWYIIRHTKTKIIARVHTCTRHACRLFFWDVSIRNSLRSNNLDKTKWVYALNTPIWGYGIFLKKVWSGYTEVSVEHTISQKRNPGYVYMYASICFRLHMRGPLLLYEPQADYCIMQYIYLVFIICTAYLSGGLGGSRLKYYQI